MRHHAGAALTGGQSRPSPIFSKPPRLAENAEGEITPTGAAAEVLAQSGLASAKPGFVDRLIHLAYTVDGAAMASFEVAAGKLASVQVL